MRKLYVKIWVAIILLSAVIGWWWADFFWSWVVLGPLFLLGLRDYCQTKHAVLRNFPLIGHFRYLFEAIRPEIQQYFVESDTNGVPFNREQRSVVYQRSKATLDTVPFGTKLNVYAEGYEWVNHSLLPTHIDKDELRIKIGGPDCQKPYRASLLNISAMSYGSLSKQAIIALNQGARMGGFAHNTGEGGLSPHHLQGGDIIWQIGTGYFGCRTFDGAFSPDMFAKNAGKPEVKMIEIKLSQGAKPGHGGILPGAKVTAEIAAIRGVIQGETVYSPPAHSTFKTPKELLTWVKQLRELSGGKPIGIKLCMGKRREFIALCKAMVATGIKPDYFAIDGGEGGTGAAPLEFSNSIGCPLRDGLIFAHNSLVGFNLRQDIRIIASGKITSTFAMLSYLALGADLCYAARAFMLSLGCIQALRCHSNHCPVGVATQNPELAAGLVPAEKSVRVKNFHGQSIAELAHILGAMGLNGPDELRPWHIMRRMDRVTTNHYGEIYEYIEAGSLLTTPIPKDWQRAMAMSTSESFVAKS